MLDYGGTMENKSKEITYTEKEIQEWREEQLQNMLLEYYSYRDDSGTIHYIE